jgi:nucleotide-binding universal stress UspA family protein
MRILIGVDDSPHSRAAVEFVKKMAWPKDSSILVLSVARTVVGVYAEAFVPAPAYVADLSADTRRFCEETAAGAERELKGTGLKTEARVLQGDPRTALVDAARTERADLVVVGSHGRTGVAKLLMGSVASHVVTHAPCSVMVVKLDRT